MKTRNFDQLAITSFSFDKRPVVDTAKLPAGTIKRSKPVPNFSEFYSLCTHGVA
jgi:hypothetical protein